MALFVDLQKQLTSYPLRIAFNLEQNTLGILGGSGSGKSMTLRCIAGIETPDRGRIVLNNRVLFDAECGINVPIRDRRIGLVFQNYALFPHLTVAQNITYGLRHLKTAERRRRLADQLTQLQLQGLEHRYPQEISGGQQQRVALARAIAVEPQVLLLDEPFSALDTYLRSQLQEQLIEALATYSGVTLFVTHNLEEVYGICQDILVIAEGKQIAYNNKQAIFERPETYTVARITGCKNFSQARAIAATEIEAIDWGCRLNVVEPIPESLSWVGIRAHHLTFGDRSNHVNTFPCWVTKTRETPHRTTVYLKLHHPPKHSLDYHLQAELFKEKWVNLKDIPLPWQVQLDPFRLFMMQPD
jgi:molybdate transport system permease protein